MRVKSICIKCIMILILAFMTQSCKAKPLEPFPTSTPSKTAHVERTPTLLAPSTIGSLVTESPECQQGTPSDISFQGNLLFYEYDNSSPPGVSRVWLWSKVMDSPQLVLEVDWKADFYLSPDGTKLVWRELDSDHFTIYDLRSRETKNYPWHESWQMINGWTMDGLISITTDYTVTYNKGVTLKRVYFDEKTLSTTAEDIILNLPGYTQDQTFHDPQLGFAITDPTESLVLYTSNEGGKGKLILVDVKSEQRLWEGTAQYPFYPYPDWTLSGDRVAFVLFSNNQPSIHALTRDGKDMNVFGKGLSQRIVRAVKWSPNERYIYYAYWATITEGPGYVLDIIAETTKEICASGYIFLNGYWLPDNQLAYTVRKEVQSNQTGTGELRILDIENWDYATIFKTKGNLESAFDISVLGWTPIVSP